MPRGRPKTRGPTSPIQVLLDETEKSALEGIQEANGGLGQSETIRALILEKSEKGRGVLLAENYRLLRLVCKLEGDLKKATAEAQEIHAGLTAQAKANQSGELSKYAREKFWGKDK